MKHNKMIAVLLALTLCATLAACSGGSSGGVDGKNIGSFTTQDMDGESVTQDIFKGFELTMVNVFTTWCSPCVSEMPDLEQLHQQVADQGVNVVGVVLDAVDEKGQPLPDVVEQAKKLVETTGVTYSVLLPDSTFMNGRLSGIDSVPLTFFVDKNGNYVGDDCVGSDALDGWLKVVDSRLSMVREAG